MRNVLVVGSVNLDFVTNVAEFATPGETIHGSDYVTHNGGKGANQAVAAARAGASVTMMAAVGTDTAGNNLMDALVQEGINTHYVQRIEGVSGAAFITVNNLGQNMIVICPGANAKITSEHVEALDFSAFDVVLVQNEIAPEATAAALRRGRMMGVTTVLNAAPVTERLRKDLEFVDVLVVNETEARSLAQMLSESISDVIEELQSHVPTVVVTLGEKGVRWTRFGSLGSLEAFEVKAVDTTAAGDSFVGHLVARLETTSWTDVLKKASAAGALAVTKGGAQPSIPSHGDVVSFVAERYVLPVHFEED